MVKLMMVIYYGLIDSVKYAALALEKMGFEVSYFSLYRYRHDIHDKRDNFLEYFDHEIKEKNPEVILWWCISIPTDEMKYIYENNEDKKHFFFNWDEPHNWEDQDIKNKAKFFDCAFVTASEKLTDYLKYGAKDACLLFPGYDPNLHQIIIDEEEEDIKKYSCDISICCTNLYENDDKYPNQYIKRKVLIDTIYNHQKEKNYVFHIYGPKFLEKLYPNSYRGFINYDDTNKVFNYSKINICTHVQSNSDQYLNERVILILGSGGLLYVDKVDGIEKIFDLGEDLVIIDREYFINQICSILDNYDDYYIIRYNGHQKSKKYTWEKWAEAIYNKLLNK